MISKMDPNKKNILQYSVDLSSLFQTSKLILPILRKFRQRIS